MKTKTLGLLIVIVVVAVAAVLAFTTRSGPSTGSAEAYSGTVIALDSFSVDAYKGKPLVINMFGSWCPPCNEEAPDLGTFATQNPGAQVIGVACEDTEKDAVAFMEEHGLSYPIVVDDGSLVSQFGITAYPTTIFFNAAGKETDRLVGAATFDQFTASLAQAQ